MLMPDAKHRQINIRPTGGEIPLVSMARLLPEVFMFLPSFIVFMSPVGVAVAAPYARSVFTAASFLDIELYTDIEYCMSVMMSIPISAHAYKQTSDKECSIAIAQPPVHGR